MAGDDEAAEEALDRDLASGQIREVLEEFRAGVSEASYRAIHLRWIEGLTVAEVASRLGLTASQVRARQHRMLVQLRVLASHRGFSASCPDTAGEVF